MKKKNEGMLSRHPPAAVLRQLREEVNYSCPICGSPFLTWHHFDPPYHVQPHHNPDGMIALCPLHHKMADSGVYSADYLRGLKHRQSGTSRIAFRWPWEPENIAFFFGGNILFGVRPVLVIRRDTVLGVYRDKFTQNDVPRILFDFDLKTRDGKLIAHMERNLFETYTVGLEDFVFAPGGNTFAIEHISGTRLKLEYHRYDLVTFERRVRDILDTRLSVDTVMDLARPLATDSEGKVPTVTITATILTRDVTLKVRARDLQMTMHCYHDEKAVMKGMLFAPTGSLRIDYEDEEVLRFG